MPAFGPARQLAFDEAFGPAQVFKPDGCRVDGMQVGQGVDQHRSDAPVQVRIIGEAVRHFAANDEAVAAFRDMEIGADDVRIVAIEETARRQREGLVQRGLDLVFAFHVVGRRRHRTHGRSPQDVFMITEGDKIGQIGMAAAELGDGQGAVGIGQAVAQVGLQPRRVEQLIGADIDGFRIQRVNPQATSNSPAAPWPPPMHMVTTTYLTPRRLPSISAWPTMRAPLMP